MRGLIVLWLAVVPMTWHPTVVGAEWDHRCPVCKALGIRSEVSTHGMTCTAVYCGDTRYDANGALIPVEPCNHCREDAICSNGHSFVVFDPAFDQPLDVTLY